MDIARGFAVMGIVLMNVIAFSMPEAAYINPAAWGGMGAADILAWVLSFILVDGKMRGLFSLLFGASMLLLMDRTEMAGGNGRHRMVIRSLWLLVIGMAHYLLLWWGDILALYAVVGLVAMLFAGQRPLALVKLAFLAFGIAGPLAGLLADHASIHLAMLTVGVVSMLGVVAYLPARRAERLRESQPTAYGDDGEVPDPGGHATDQPGPA